MSADLRALEQEVERELRLLDALPAPALRPEALARVQSAVAAAVREQPRATWLPRAARGGAVAAAILLAVGLASLPEKLGSVDGAARGEESALLAEWGEALDAVSAGAAVPSAAALDADNELRDFLDGLDAVLGRGV